MSELTPTESEVLRLRLAPWVRLAVVALIAGAATALVSRRFRRLCASARLGGLAALFVAALVFAPTASGQSSGPEFADWTAAGANVASGTLQGQPISLSGSHVSSIPASTVDGSSTVFAESYFSPPLPRSDALEFRGWPGYSYVLRFGAPTKDPVLHLASLASTLRFPGGTSITRLSGENDSFTVSGSSVSGALDGPNDANGTVRLNGVFESVSFSAEPVQPLIQPDGIYIQVGAPPPPEPPPPPVEAGVLDYSIYTVYKHADGTLVRRETATKVGVPTPVEVGDGDIAPDLAATFLPLSTDRFRLRVDRALFETSPLPVSVEATAKEPSAGTLPRQRLAFGYDARASRAPQSFDTEIRVGELASEPDATTLAIDYETTGAGAAMDVIGGLYNGTARARTDPVGARLGYTPVPPQAGIDLVIGRRLALRKETVSPTRLTVDAELVDGASERRAHAVLDRLPSWIELTHERLGEDRRKVTYAAAAPVGRFALDYSDRAGGVLARAATVSASDLPTGMVLEQTSAKAGTFQTSGGSLGSVEVGYAENGAPRLLRGATTPYGYVLEDGQLRSYAGRVDGLTRASFDGSGPIVVDAELATRTPFAFKIDAPDLKANGDLEDLPRHVRASVDLSAGRIDYDGFGDTIDRITLADASKPTGFFPAASKPLNRVTHIEATVRELPSKVTVTLKPGSQEGAGFTASEPIGSIEALLSSDPEATIADSGLPADESGFRVQDLPDRATAFGRIKGLKEVNVVSAENGRLTARAKVARQKLRAIYESVLKDVGHTTVDARMSEIPSDITLMLDLKRENVTYRASDGVESLELGVDSARPLARRARHIEAKVRGIPAALDLFLLDTPEDAGGGDDTLDPFGARLTAVPRVESIEALLSSDPKATIADSGLPAGESGFKYEDVPERFTVFGRAKGLRMVGATRESGQSKISAAAKVDRQKLRVIYAGSLPDGNVVTADGRLSEIPDDIAVTFDPKEGQTSYRAQQGIDTLDAKLTGAQPLFGRVKQIAAHVEGIPRELDLGFKPPSGSGGSFNATPAVDLIEAELSDGSALTDDDRLAPGRSGVVVRDHGGKFKVFGRLRKVTAGSVTSTGEGAIDASVSTGKLADGTRQGFELDAELDEPGDAIRFPAKVKGSISALPEKVTISQRGSRTDYVAEGEDTTVPLVTLNASNLPGDKLLGEAHEVRATLKGVPNKFTLRSAGGVLGTGIDATDATDAFDRIDLALWDAGSNPVTSNFPEAGREAGHNKATVYTRRGRLGAKFRVFGLKKALYADSPISKVVETAFKSPPAPFDFELLGDEKKSADKPATLDRCWPAAVGDEYHCPTLVKVGAKELGTKSTFEVRSLSGTTIGYDANVETADVHAELEFVDMSALLDLDDIPGDTDVCIGSERWINYDFAATGAAKECDGKSPSTFEVEDDEIGPDEDNAALVDDFVIRTKSRSTLTARGKICLPPTDDEDPPKPIRDAPPVSYCSDYGENYVLIDNLRVKDALVEFASGDSQSLEDGEPTDDDLLKLYVDTDEHGLSVDRLYVLNSWTKDSLEVKTGPPHPLRNMNLGKPFFAVLDTDPSGPDPIPDLEAWNGQRLDCRNLFIDTDAPLVDDVIGFLKNVPGAEARKICFFG